VTLRISHWAAGAGPDNLGPESLLAVGFIMRGFIYILVLLGLLVPTGLRAASAGETRAFNAAARGFTAGSYEWAEKEFGDFLKKYPNADRSEEAWLSQAQCRFKLKRFQAVVDLLNLPPARATRQPDQVLYWRAEAYFALTNHPAAAAEFARLLSQFPNSPRQLDASLGEAAARFKLGELPRVVELLRPPEGVFQKAARTQPDNEATLRGNLLLGEALLNLREFHNAEEVLAQLAKRNAPTELRWQNIYLLARAQLAAGKVPAADETAVKLLPLAVASGQRPLLANSHALRGEIFEQLNQLEVAIEAYTNNLASGFPEASRRQALFQIVKLNLIQNKTTNAIERLESFARENTKDAALDYVQFTLGELRLKQYFATVDDETRTATPAALAAGTNLLAQALTHFDLVISGYTNSPLLGMTWLNRGWCLWNQGQMAGSLASFREATTRLPASEERAKARFKWADAQFQLQDFSGAITNYQRMIDDHGELPEVKNSLVEQAQYQIVRAGIALGGDLAPARQALQKMLADHPRSEYADRSLLLVGQALSDRDEPAASRALLADLIQRFPSSPLVPVAQLAVARTYSQAQDWRAAIGELDGWVSQYPDHGSRPQVEFDRAWLNYKAGNVTNALNLFTNLVGQFSTNALAAVAQMWVADYYFRQGDFVTAEKNYQSIYQNTNWPPTELTFRAHFNAARSAIGRQSYSDAIRYLQNQLNDLRCPLALVPETLFALGDTLIMDADADPKNPLDNYAEAIKAFGRITQNHATNPIVAKAYGRIADCHLQLAIQDVSRYKLAIDFYRQAMDSPFAENSTRSLAEVGLAKALEKQAQQKPVAEQAPLLDESLKHYLNVVYRSQPTEGEGSDLVSVKEAGLAAGRLLEAQLRWTEAHSLYKALLEILPALKVTWEKKLAQTRDRAEVAP
jgi:tetratricopeptide (TPR) repeat protein